MAHQPHRLTRLLLFLLIVLGLTTTRLVPPSSSSALQVQPHPTISTVDLTALAAIKDSLTDVRRTGTQFFSTWDFASPDPCSTFAGVVCSADAAAHLALRVTSLSLGTGLSSDSRGLAGTLSPSIANLTQLTQLVLFPGIVTGPVPPQLGSLSSLRVISLTRNRLTGPIPDSLSHLPALHTLDLSYNQLSGSIPAGLARLPGLKVLVLASNRLSGDLPEFSRTATQLLHLDLQRNRLTGTLPAQLPPSVRYFSVAGNLMWGPLDGLGPGGIGLEYLDLSGNGFSGTIPPVMFQAPNITSLLLQRNNLSGGVPRDINISSSLTTASNGLSVVDLSYNGLSGELTRVLAGVGRVFLNNNKLSGAVPGEYVEGLVRGTTKILYLQHNYFTGFQLMPPPASFPPSASLCATYNCMQLPAQGLPLMACPSTAGLQLSRPAHQCSSPPSKMVAVP